MAPNYPAFDAAGNLSSPTRARGKPTTAVCGSSRRAAAPPRSSTPSAASSPNGCAVAPTGQWLYLAMSLNHPRAWRVSPLRAGAKKPARWRWWSICRTPCPTAWRSPPPATWSSPATGPIPSSACGALTVLLNDCEARCWARQRMCASAGRISACCSGPTWAAGTSAGTPAPGCAARRSITPCWRRQRGQCPGRTL